MSDVASISSGEPPWGDPGRSPPPGLGVGSAAGQPARKLNARVGLVPLVAFVVAVVIRMGLFPFAENKHGDAPMRTIIAARMNADPAAAADPRAFCQYGPLPILVMRPFLLAGATLGLDETTSSRVPALLAGLLAFWALGRFARRVAGERAAGLALFALALSPLHIQASTTAASEALYVFLVVIWVDRLVSALSDGRGRDFLLAGLFASLAAVTRFDAWIAIPATAAVALLLVVRAGARAPVRAPRAATSVLGFAGLAAILPASYVLWHAISGDHPLGFARYINEDHAQIAAAQVARLGGALARLRQVGIWIVSFAAALTPLLLIALLMRIGAAAAFVRRLFDTRTPAAQQALVARAAGMSVAAPVTVAVVFVAALAPPAAYLAKGLLFGDFDPLPRFALPPGVLLLPFAAGALLTWRRMASARAPFVGVAAGALLLIAGTQVIAHSHPERIWAGPESLGPLTRLDAEDRALAAFLRQRRAPRELVFLDTLQYRDLSVSHAAAVPAALSVTVAKTRTFPATLASARATTGAHWFALHDDAWAQRLPPDWPSDERRFGKWRLVHVPGSAGASGETTSGVPNHR